MSLNPKKWSEFGDQVNRLVYALAGRKFQGNIACANRFVAEQIHYSEASVRMMRQGRFRPQEDQAIEWLVEIGCQEGELSRAWASRLLYSARHPTPEAVLESMYCQAEDPAPVVKQEEKLPAASALYAFRILASFFGSLAAALVWAYFISPNYPAAHELGIVTESVWGVVVGIGIAAGIAGADLYLAVKQADFTRKNWRVYLALPAGGLTGALLWSRVGERLFQSDPTLPLQSGSLETFAFGALYGLGFSLAIAVLRAGRAGKPFEVQELFGILLLVPLAGSFAWAGWLLATRQPAFANQKDVDLFVGILLRCGLILGTSRWFPPFWSYSSRERAETPAAVYSRG